MIAAAKPLSQHIENLLSIEQYTGCRFTPNLGDISSDDYYTAQKLAASIKGEWYIIRGKFDNGVRADHDRIAEEILRNPDKGRFGSESSVIRISLHDQLFTADKAHAQYDDARISNFGAVKRAVSRQRKNIRIIIKPQYGKDYFLKYVRFDGLRRLADEECE